VSEFRIYCVTLCIVRS